MTNGHSDIDFPAASAPESSSRRQAKRPTPIIDALLAIVVAIGLLAAGFWAWHWWQNRGPAPHGASTANGVVFGPSGAATVVDLYLDPLCPGCRALETNEASQLAKLIDSGDQVRYHVVSFLDRESPDHLSSRTANAAYCAADQGHFQSYLAAMVSQINGAAPTPNSRLIAIGAQAGITSPSFASCINGGRYRPFVRRVTSHTTGQHITGVPTVIVNGNPAPLPTPPPRCQTSSSCSTGP